MSNQYLKLRRSSVPGKIPTTASLDFGEIALNTYDGLAFMKKSGSAGEEIIIIGSTSGSFTGSLFGTASYALTSSYSLNIDGQQYYIATFNGSNSLTSSTIYQSGSYTSLRYETVPEDPNNPEILYVPGYGVDTYNLISVHTDYDNYAQINIRNYSSGSNASSDIVATNNIGTETSYYVNMGINGDGYNVVDGIGQQNDAYLYSTGEDLLIGNASYGKRVIIFNGTGSAIDVARIFIVPEGTVGINAVDPNPSNPESLLVEPIQGATNPSQFSNLIIGKGNIGESYIQANIINLGTGSGASADIVATNDIGTEADYYIDMGINSSNYSTPNAVGMANDAYLYSTGEHLHIGNASADMPVMIFAGGLDAEANRKLEIWPDDQHYMTGSLEMSGSLKVRIVDQNDSLTSLVVVDTSTGLLQYTNTASYANIAATASSADDFILRGSLTGSDALFTGTVTAQTLHVQYITASTEFITGSTIFGSQLTDTHEFTGSVSITGSLSIKDLTLNSGLTQFVVVDPATGELYYNISGAAGSSGTSGSSGSSGSSGTSGVDGSSGTSGTAGSSGTSGSSGQTGTSGTSGTSGESGTSGTSGTSGESGTSGTSGQTGVSGTSGTSGESGSSGTSGSSGSSGSSGTSGQDGSSGTSGTSGISGTAGSSGTSGIGAFPYTGSAIISGSLEIIGPLTASNALFTGTITAQTLNVQYITASTEYITGSTIFGSSLNNTHQFTGSVSITGSLTVNGNLNATSSWATNALTASFVTGSNVYGPYGSNSIVSASHAVTASYALNAGGAGASNQIVSGSVTASVNINSASFQVVSGSTNLLFVSNSGLITAQRLFLSSSQNMASGSTLVVFGSGSAQPVFTVQGSQGELFSVNDSLSGSLFSVNDISGLPIIEAFSDNRVFIGSYQAPMLTTTVRTTLAVGNNMIYQNVPTASYDAVFFEYSLKSGSSARAGSIMGIWSGSDANYNEVVTADYGDTTGVKFMVMVTGSNVALTGSATTANWTMKTIVRGI